MLLSGAASRGNPVLERGAYLVTGVMNCGNCHSPKGPPAAVAGKDFSGGLSWDVPPFKVTAANITQDKETGIGSWSDADIKKLLRTGMRPNGTPIAAIMPTGFYGIITESDMDAIVAYLRTIKPVSNTVPAPVYQCRRCGRRFSRAPSSPTRKLSWTTNSSAASISPRSAIAWNATRRWSKATTTSPMTPAKAACEFPGPWGVSVSRNITSSKTKGIGDWTDAEIKHAITEGIDKDGKKLKPPDGLSVLCQDDRRRPRCRRRLAAYCAAEGVSC